MSELLVQPRWWRITDKTCVFIVFELLDIWHGSTQKHKDFVQELYDILYYNNSYSAFYHISRDALRTAPEHILSEKRKPYYDSFEYEYYHGLSRNTFDYIINELHCLRKDEMRQFKVWYEEFLSLEPQTEALFIFIPFIQEINKIINNFEL